MKYNLKFIKISPKHEFAGVGFAGNIFITLNALTHTTKDDKLFVDMETNECVCTEKDIIHDTKNSWEYYFEQTNILDNKGHIKNIVTVKIGDKILSFNHKKNYCRRR